MLADTDRQRRRWIRGHGSWFTSDADERAYAGLLDALTEDLADTQVADVERRASARRSQADVIEESEQIRAEELDVARDELGAFRAALEDARARGAGSEGGEVAYDSADPREDRLADALIQHLVRTGYGEVRTEELGEGHYRYHLRVDWPRLEALAREQGQPLPS